MNAHDHNTSGSNGVVNVEGTTAYTGDLYSVQCITACVFTEFTERGMEGSTKVTEGTAGQTIINGQGITAVTASAGNKWRGNIRFV